ncbi:hypothetical protein D3C85_1599260 [compost metagenome]
MPPQLPVGDNQRSKLAMGDCREHASTTLGFIFISEFAPGKLALNIHAPRSI